MRAGLWCLVLAAAGMVAGCGGGSGVTDVRADPELMRAVPDVVLPGGEMEVIFPHGSSRGPGFVLERNSLIGWTWHYAVSSATDAPDMVNVWTAAEFTERNIEWDAGPGFDNTDPHVIPVPEDARTGRWRVCTVPDTPSLCAEFDVTAED